MGKKKGHRTVKLPEELMETVDLFLAENSWGYRSRAEILTTALREWLARTPLGPPQTQPDARAATYAPDSEKKRGRA